MTLERPCSYTLTNQWSVHIHWIWPGSWHVPADTGAPEMAHGWTGSHKVILIQTENWMNNNVWIVTPASDLCQTVLWDLAHIVSTNNYVMMMKTNYNYLMKADDKFDLFLMGCQYLHSGKLISAASTVIHEMVLCMHSILMSISNTAGRALWLIWDELTELVQRCITSCLPETPPATYAAIINPTEKPMCTVRGSPRVFRLRTVWATEPQPNNWPTGEKESNRLSPTSVHFNIWDTHQHLRGSTLVSGLVTVKWNYLMKSISDRREAQL